jgi:uncharacterized membrane protein YkvA (DUF1232 family)
MNQTTDRIQDFYELLGVHEKATREEIRQAYRSKLKAWHPDRNRDRIEEAEQMTKALNAAYHVLSHPERRKTYDRMLRFTRGKDFGRYVHDQAFWRKLEKASPTLKRILENVMELYALFNDAMKGRYKLHPVTLGVIGGGLLYFIIPADLVPDVIPFVGFLDDMAVLTTIINSLQGELVEYRGWKRREGRQEKRVPRN